MVPACERCVNVDSVNASGQAGSLTKGVGGGRMGSWSVVRSGG